MADDGYGIALVEPGRNDDGGIRLAEIVLLDELDGPAVDPPGGIDLIDRHAGAEGHGAADGVGEGAGETDPDWLSGVARRKQKRRGRQEAIR